MRYFKIPQPSQINVNGETIPYGWREHVRDTVSGHPDWRKSAEALDVLEAILEKSEAADYAPGAVLELTDKEHETATAIVTVAGVNLNPVVARPVNRIARAWLGAGLASPQESTP